MERDVNQMLQALAAKVADLRADACEIVDALRSDYKRASAASIIADRLDLVASTIQDVVDYPASSASTPQ